MITTFNAMPSPASGRTRWRLPIIAVLLTVTMALSGCGMAMKLGYGQGSPIAFRWLDGYVDFNDAQSLRVRGALDEWFGWNRRTQLSDYADLLARAEVELLADMAPQRMCGWADEVRARFDAGLDHAAPTIVELAPTLSLQQIANIEKRYAQRNEGFRDDFMQRDAAKRRKASIEREVGRAETLYGRLDAAQRELVARSVAESPYDAELSYAERTRRQQDALATLRKLAATHPIRVEAEAEFRAYVQRLDRSPRDAYRRYSARLVDYNCSFASTLHNATSVEQRRHAAALLHDYELDLRSLAADAAG